jgi:hypothetical protein
MRIGARRGLGVAAGLALVLVAATAVMVTPVALGAGDANEATCPNETMEGFREYLPDCRAYEMVSPPFKEGRGLALTAVSSDGSRAFAESLGVFAGAEGGSPEVSYELVRSGSGWVASSLNPPARLFPYGVMATASSDLGKSLWIMRGVTESVYAEDLYVREGSGSFVEVGPVLPPSLTAGPPSGPYSGIGAYNSEIHYAGASVDLSHILFRIEGEEGISLLWPGDTTVNERERRSLYEYTGTGNAQPTLVGVEGAGRLISDCGTVLGSSEDAYNAVSSDGGTVFFTAQPIGGGCSLPVGGVAPEVQELWARLGGVESVVISEPPSSQCQACDVAAVKKPAVFQGASEDGSKVFFLTEQELFAGDTGMNLYEYDFDNPSGRKIIRVSGGSAAPDVQGVARVSEDGSHVYFVAKGALAGKNAEGSAPTPGEDNLYLFERDAAYPAGRLAFVATLSEADAHDWGSFDIRPVQATPDGRFMAFQSVADLTPGDVSGEPQIFEYDALQEELVRVSRGQTGYANGLTNANMNGSSIPEQGYGNEDFQPTMAATNLAVSAVGEGANAVSRVVFSSAGALTPGAEEAAAAGVGSVYEYRSVGSIADGNVYLISDGRSGGGVVGLDASGEDVFFSTVAPLLVQDVDTAVDVYDARADGGFPTPTADVGCEGEDCQGGLPVGPSLAVAESTSAVAGGNLTLPVGSEPVASKPKPKPKAKAKRRRRHGVKHRRKGGSVRDKKSVVDTKGRG